jgi:hypothetical protein
MHRQKQTRIKFVVFTLVASFLFGRGPTNPARSEVINIGWTGGILVDVARLEWRPIRASLKKKLKPG